jgi:lipoyl(octanoyl) transferase
MQAFNSARTAETPDQLWVVQHPPVYTLGLAGRPEHVLAPRSIPVVKTDRGGQVTYHGPGQVVAYPMLDLRRAGFGVKELVRRLEQSVLDTLAAYGIEGRRREGMPGVYVGDAKIAAVGLRIARGCSYHGIALNADLDLEPFSRIDPCGYPGLASTRLADLGVRDKISQVQERFERSLLTCLTPR